MTMKADTVLHLSESANESYTIEIPTSGALLLSFEPVRTFGTEYMIQIT